MTYVPWLAGQTLTADDLDSLLIEETMAWTDLASLGSYATNFSAGTPAPRMHKLMVLGVEVWEFEGRINTTSLAAATNTTVFTFNTGYRVAHERGFQQFASNSSFYGIRMAFESTGALQVGLPTAAGSSCSGFSLDGIVITNPLT